MQLAFKDKRFILNLCSPLCKGHCSGVGLAPLSNQAAGLEHAPFQYQLLGGHSPNTSIWAKVRSWIWHGKASWPSTDALITWKMLTMGGYECRGRNLRAALEQDHEKKCQDAHRHTRKDSRSSSNKVSTAFAHCWHHISANQYTLQNRGQCNGQDYTEVSKHQDKQLSPSTVLFHHVLWRPTKITHIISDLSDSAAIDRPTMLGRTQMSCLCAGQMLYL